MVTFLSKSVYRVKRYSKNLKLGDICRHLVFVLHFNFTLKISFKHIDANFLQIGYADQEIQRKIQYKITK